LYVTWQLLLTPLGDPSVQVADENVPPPDVENVTVPSGATDPVPDVSVTVAVQVALPPAESDVGTQEVLVAVGRVTAKL
jgi:hypothetical protein